jgi:glyoxylase-like metal-dependent hydrolase (beta-lactamase superfamily II)
MNSPLPEPFRFTIGDLRCSVISDGHIAIGRVGETVLDSDGGLPDGYTKETPLEVDINLMLIEREGLRVLIDSGGGSLPDLGVPVFGGRAGQTPAVLRSLGVEPQSIDVVILTHAHPDHAWGLIETGDRPVYPNARLLVGAVEFEHWMSEVSPTSGPIEKLTHEGARRSLDAYDGRVSLLDDGDRPFKWLTVREHRGHSPGHLVFEIADGGEKLVFLGDICHIPLLLAAPGLNLIFDHDPPAAVQSRRQVLDQLAESGEEVLSCHFDHPGLGRMTKSPDGSYGWLPSAARS